MATRWFEHGAAEVLSRSPLFAACGGQIEFCPDADRGAAYSSRGLALVELEFLSRHARSGFCVYARAGDHLALVASAFPALHFYAFECAPDAEDYDPDRPAIRAKDYGPNVTPSVMQLTRETGAGLRGADALILHPADSADRQLLLHTLLRPARSLFSLCGDMPEEYVSGNLYYPLYTPVSSGLVHLVAGGRACLRLYFPRHLRDELGHFQVLVRCGTDYDSLAQEQIVQGVACGHEHAAEYMRQALCALL